MIKGIGSNNEVAKAKITDSGSLQVHATSDDTDHIVTILTTETESNSFELLPGHSIVGIYTPSAWTAADLTFKVSNNGSDFVPVYDTDGNLVTVTVGANQYIRFNPSDWVGLQYVMFASSVAQGSDRDFLVVSRLV